eukprot:1493952-Amphidinium_carterae.1
MGTVGRIGGPVGLELGAGFIFAPVRVTGTKESMIDCGGGLNPFGKITWEPSLASHTVGVSRGLIGPGTAAIVGSAIASGTGWTTALAGGPRIAGGPIFPPLASPFPFGIPSSPFP